MNKRSTLVPILPSLPNFGRMLRLTSILPLLSSCSTQVGGVEPPTDDPSSDADAGDPSQNPTACGQVTFELSETQEDFTVPQDVLYLHVKAWGAGGNHEGQCEGDDGGVGGFTEAIFEVTEGMELAVIVGKRGRVGDQEDVRFGFGNYGGGGLSGVFTGHELITKEDNQRALLIAGGGGSAGRKSNLCDPGGPGNHPDSGGAPTMLGTNGGENPGGDSVNGGAGGYAGGLGGVGTNHSLGGAGFVAPSALESQMLWAEYAAGVPPKTDDPDYDPAKMAGYNEYSGLVVMHFECERPSIEID